MLQIKNLSKSYGAKKAISNLSFVVEDGDIMGFIGKNGAGKTRSSWEQKPKRPQAPPPRCISALMLLLYICRTLYLRKSMTLPRC